MNGMVLQECFARLRSACTPGPAFTPASCQRSSTEGSLLAALSSFRDAAGSSDAAAALPARPQPSRTTGSLAALVSEVHTHHRQPLALKCDTRACITSMFWQALASA